MATRRASALGKAIAAAILAAGLFVAWRVLPLGDWLTRLQTFVSGLGPSGAVLYGAVYVVAALCFVPGSLMSLGAGLVFGFGWGTVIVSLASTTAAGFAFLIARYAARRRVEELARKNDKFEAIDRAIGKNGWKVVGLLRLSPLIPFSISNYLYGLTSVSFVPYLLASWVGMLPGTFLYVYLGTLGSAAGRASEKSPWEWVWLGVGLVATAAVTILLTRVAKKELKRSRVGAA